MFNWQDFLNDFPYTNFSDINVSWFLNKFKQVFDEWEGLYNQMLSWKTATDEYNANWRQEQETAFQNWENNFQSAIDAWKAQTETDINTWEHNTIANLESWKNVFITEYNTLKAEVEQIALDAENAKNSAQASATSAQQSADNASATALALQASLQQIDNNTDDISNLKKSFNIVTEKTRNLFDVDSVEGNGITVNNGVLSGTASAFKSNFGTDTQGLASNIQFENNTVYTVSLKGKNDDGSNNKDGLIVRIRYTDNMQTQIVYKNDTTDYMEKTIVSTNGKTIEKIEISFSSNASFVWHLTDIQIEKGNSKTAYVPFISAVDFNAREQISKNIENINYLESISFDEFFLEYEPGSISGTNGSLIDNDTKTIRAFINNTEYDIKKIKIICDTGYTYALRFFDVDNNMMSAIVFTSNIIVYDIPENTVTIGICIRSTANITPSAGICAKIFVNINASTAQTQNDIELLGKNKMSNYISKIIADVVNLSRNNKLLNIGYVTDTHSNEFDSTFSINAMNAILTTKIMDICIHGGDIITSRNMTYNEYMLEMCKNMAYYKSVGNMVFIKGNHDVNHSTDELEDITAIQYHILMQNNIHDAVFNPNNPFTCYFYIDYTLEKTRLIFIDTFTRGAPASLYVDAEQSSWIYNTALNVPDGYTVMVFAHQFNNTLTDVCNIFKAFNDRGTAYGNYMFSTNITTKFVGVVHGHEHYDTSSTSEGFNIIGVRQGFGENGGLDIFTIDSINNKLYEFRIGGGSNRKFSF